MKFENKMTDNKTISIEQQVKELMSKFGTETILTVIEEICDDELSNNG